MIAYSLSVRGDQRYQLGQLFAEGLDMILVDLEEEEGLSLLGQAANPGIGQRLFQ